MSDDPPFGSSARRSRIGPGSRIGPAVLIATLVLALGLGLMIFAIRDEPNWLRRGTAATTMTATPTRQPVQASAPPATIDAQTLSERETTLAAQIANLEARAATLGTSAADAETRAGRAEAILIAFAARRAIDRGLGLGYLEEQLRARFANNPREAAAVIHASRNPVTLEDLRQGLDSAAPVLLARESDWWAGVGAELRNLVVIHEAGTPSPLPADRLARVRRMIDAGNVDGALAEAKRLPGAAKAQGWTGAAQRYVDAHRALDQLETTAIVGAVTQPVSTQSMATQPEVAPSTVAPSAPAGVTSARDAVQAAPLPAPTADVGNYL